MLRTVLHDRNLLAFQIAQPVTYVIRKFELFILLDSRVKNPKDGQMVRRMGRLAAMLKIPHKVNACV